MTGCECQCHRTEQINHFIFGKMTFCDCNVPHEKSENCKVNNIEPIDMKDYLA